MRVPSAEELAEEHPDPHPAWLPPDALRALGSRRVLVRGQRPLIDIVLAEVAAACARFGGSARHESDDDPPGDEPADLILALAPDSSDLGDEGFTVTRGRTGTHVTAAAPSGLLYGFFHVVRHGDRVFAEHTDHAPMTGRHRPASPRRMLDHWDNIDVHPVMGQVERGYAGGSLFWDDGRLRTDLDRVRGYGRLLAACGVNALAINNVNVHRTEARLLTDRLGDVIAIADQLRPYGVRTHLSVSFAAPLSLGGLPTADPLDPQVRAWWVETTRRVYAAVPDFGGYVVKADSEGQPGPHRYGRTHADGANMLAEAVAPHGGVIHWRAFVYDHRQDWRDRSTDRANAAHDHFTPLDGDFHDAVVLQVKHGPMDFQVREPVSPVIGAMPHTRLAVELQVTQEYTGQQQHLVYLAPMWSQVLRFRFGAETESSVERLATGGLVGVSNAGADRFWTGHPLAQANLYAFGRLAWDPQADPLAILDEWIDLTFPGGDPAVRDTLHTMMDRSWLRYEEYTAPLGVGWMVGPATRHYGPDIDGYEYSPWGTYHFADREGVGVDRTIATGTGYAGRYPVPWSAVYEDVEACPDELLLFFHHVPYDHRLHSGRTVIQHIYDTHFEGVRKTEAVAALWGAPGVADAVGSSLHARVRERLVEQVRCAREWRDQVNTYFFRKSGIPDAQGRTIY